MSSPSPPESSSPEEKSVAGPPKPPEINGSPEVSMAGPSKGETTGEYLENLSKSIIEVGLNLKDREHPLTLKHMSTQFRNKHDALPKSNDRDTHKDNLDKHLSEQEDFHCEILNSSSEVDNGRGRATVYMWYDISGLKHGLEREGVAVFSWERKDGLWKLMKHTGMRGPSGFP